MIILVYNILLTVLLVCFCPFIFTALLLRPDFRVGLTQRLGRLPTHIIRIANSRRPVWLHAPSVGEILATRPFLTELKRAFPDRPLLLSVQTSTGLEAAKTRCPNVDGVFYFPLDHPFVSLSVIRRIRPCLFLFTETELWPNILLGLAKRSIPTVLVSGRFSQRAHRRSSLAPFIFPRVLRRISLCCMQTREDADRIISAGAAAETVHVTGNFKFDNVGETDPKTANLLTHECLSNHIIIIGASTHAPEEKMLIEAFSLLRKEVENLVLLLAPRHPHRFGEVLDLIQNSKYSYIRRSDLDGPTSLAADIFFLDTIGELAGLYQDAALVFVGGSMKPHIGGHSVIEPGAAGVPVFFGPHTRNFKSIVSNLKHAEGGIQINDAKSLASAALPLLLDPALRLDMGQRARITIERERGAAKRTIGTIAREYNTMSLHRHQV